MRHTKAITLDSINKDLDNTYSSFLNYSIFMQKKSREVNEQHGKHNANGL